MTLPRNNTPQLDLDKIEAGLPTVEQKTEQDDRDIREQADLDRDGRTLQHDLIRAKIKNIESDRRMRETYADRIIRFLYWYSGTCGSLLALDGISLPWINCVGFDLPDEILITLVGSTALAAIGLVGFVARGLFRPPPEN